MSVKINSASGQSTSPRPNLETPAELVQNAQVETMTTIDARGRHITVGRFSALHYYRLTKVLGQAASNSASLDMAVLVCSIRKIDEEDIPMPATEKEVEMLLQRLDFDGLAAIGDGLALLNGPKKDKGDEENLVAKN